MATAVPAVPALLLLDDMSRVKQRDALGLPGHLLDALDGRINVDVEVLAAAVAAAVGGRSGRRGRRRRSGADLGEAVVPCGGGKEGEGVDMNEREE